MLETSEIKPPPELYRAMLTALKEYGLFRVIAGVLVGAPQDQVYAEAYKTVLVDVIDDPGLPVLWNINVGHAAPRCIVPFGVEAAIDAERQVISFCGSPGGLAAAAAGWYDKNAPDTAGTHGGAML